MEGIGPMDEADQFDIDPVSSQKQQPRPTSLQNGYGMKAKRRLG